MCPGPRTREVSGWMETKVEPDLRRASGLSLPTRSVASDLPWLSVISWRSRPRAVRSAGGQHLLAPDAAAVHLVVQADHRRAAELPGQAVPGGAAHDELLGEEGMDVAQRIGLHRGGAGPTDAEQAHPPFHLAQHPAGLGAESFGREVTGGDDVVAVTALPLRRLSAAGDGE